MVAPMSAAPNREGSRPAAPPIRLRYVLLVGLLGLLGLWAYPRAQAAWRLHTTAGSLADYGLCMVGPTGPSLIRDSASDFRRMVRRRLVAAAPDEQVFASCSKLAREITGKVEVERAHRATAAEFVEYGGAAADRAQAGSRDELSVDHLHISAQPLAELSRRAWPFIRDGYVRRLRPSKTADEAMHPVALPKPGIGHGLPAWRTRYRAVARSSEGFLVAFGKGANLSVYRSSDDGLTWRPASLRDPRLREFAERCPIPGTGKSFEVALDPGATHWQSISSGPAGAPEVTELGPGSLELFALACDESGLVAALRSERRREVQLVLCEHRGRCAPMPTPQFDGKPVRYPLDLARTAGATIVAVNMHDLVRVTSTRDDGRTWTPFSLAFDGKAHPDVRTEVAVPGRLLALGERVFLYGGADRPSASYPVLISEDLGASFKAPESVAIASRTLD